MLFLMGTSSQYQGTWKAGLESHQKKVSFLKGSSSDNSVGKESACNAGDLGLIPGLGRSTGEGIDFLFQDAGASLMA